MLATIQQFAAERLREFRKERAARNQHLAYFLDLSERAAREIHRPHQVAWIDRLVIKQDNFRAALGWCMSQQKTESALRLLTMLAWLLRGNYGELFGWFEKIRSLVDIYLYNAGLVALHRNDYSLALERFKTGLDLAWPKKDLTSVCHLLIGVAAVAAGINRPKCAARLSGAAQAIMDTLNDRLPLLDRAEFDRHIQIARAQLTELAFEEHVAAGRTLTLEQAVIYVLEHDKPPAASLPSSERPPAR